MPLQFPDAPRGMHYGKSDDGGVIGNLYSNKTGKLVKRAKAYQTPDPEPFDASWDADSSSIELDRFDGSASSESAPDISGLVPLALVAVAGIAIGAVGIKAAQNARKKKQSTQIERSAAHATSSAPAGWYEVAGDQSKLRYWSGSTWTDEYAQRAASAPLIAADWYPDPSNTAQMRYWNGTAWTHHVSPTPGTVTTPADWYPDPSNPTQLRYWDGSAWTGHVTHAAGASLGVRSNGPNFGGAELAPAHAEPKVNMSSAEWRAHVEAWLRVGAVEQELWRRLSNAHIQDADEATLEAQRRMETLTPEGGARRIQLLLAANPALREQASLVDLVRLIGGDTRQHLGLEAIPRPPGSV